MSIYSKKGHLSPEFALLGLLYQQPMHGYELHRKLTVDLGHVWHVSQSEAYAILKRLETHGYLSNQPIPQAKLPPRQLLQITQAGGQHFEEWMRTPTGSSVRAIRMEFLTRLYFSQAENEQIFNMQQAEIEKNIERLKTTLQRLPAEQVFNRLSLELRIRQLNLVLNWLDDCKTSLSKQNQGD